MTGSEPVSRATQRHGAAGGRRGAAGGRSRDRAGHRARGGESVSTADLLGAVFEVYGRLMDRALYLRGATREELLERIAEMAEHASAER